MKPFHGGTGCRGNKHIAVATWLYSYRANADSVLFGDISFNKSARLNTTDRAAAKVPKLAHFLPDSPAHYNIADMKPLNWTGLAPAGMLFCDALTRR